LRLAVEVWRHSVVRRESLAVSFDVWRRKLRVPKSAKKAAREFVGLTPVSAPTIGGWTVEIELPDGRLAGLRC